MYGGPIEKLNELLAGKTVERVEPATGAYEGGQFTLVTRTIRPDGKPGKLFFIRVCGTDLGWWYETRTGTNGKWKEVDE